MEMQWEDWPGTGGLLLTTQSAAHSCLPRALCQGRAWPEVGQFSQRGLRHLFLSKL